MRWKTKIRWSFFYFYDFRWNLIFSSDWTWCPWAVLTSYIHHVQSSPEFVLALWGLHWIVSFALSVVGESPVHYSVASWFNPLTFWAVIRSVKLQLSAQSAAEATVADSFQFFYFCNPIWCTNDHPLVSMPNAGGERSTLPWAQFSGAAMLGWISMLGVRCFSLTGSGWVPKLILYCGTVRWCRIASFCCSVWLRSVPNHTLRTAGGLESGRVRFKVLFWWQVHTPMNRKCVWYPCSEADGRHWWAPLMGATGMFPGYI